jgi:hypothetical protein
LLATPISKTPKIWPIAIISVNFSLTCRRVYKHVNVKLADVGPKKKKRKKRKAFENSTEGVIFGTHFDSEKMTEK